MSSLGIKVAELLSNRFIEKIAGGTVTFYAGGTKRPTYVGHPLVRGCMEVLSFNLDDPAGIMNMADGNLYIQLAEQTSSYDNYSVPNFYRIYTSEGEAVYQGLAMAHGRSKPKDFDIVTLVSKMLYDEYYHPDYQGGGPEYTQLPPNYKCSLTNFAIRL